MRVLFFLSSCSRPLAFFDHLSVYSVVKTTSPHLAVYFHQRLTLGKKQFNLSFPCLHIISSTEEEEVNKPQNHWTNKACVDVANIFLALQTTCTIYAFSFLFFTNLYMNSTTPG